MPFLWENDMPYTNFHELNLDWFINKFKEIFEEWGSLYNQLTTWKDTTDAELEAWKTARETDIESWETATLTALDAWKTATETDIGTWETATLTALDAWKTAAETAFEAIRVQAAASATAAAGSATDAETAKTAAIAAQTAAETAAASVTASAEQIATNTADISDLKTQINTVKAQIENINLGTLTEGHYINTNGVLVEGTNPAARLSDYIDISQGPGWIKAFLESVNSENVISFYDSSYSYIGGIVGGGAKEYSIGFPQNAKYIRVSLFVLSHDINENYLMWDYQKEDITEEDFLEYEAENCLVRNVEYVRGAYCDLISGGYSQTNTNAYSTDAIEIPKNVVKIESTFSALNIECAIALYDVNMNRIGYVAGIGDESHTYTIDISNSAKYFRISGWKLTVNPPETYKLYFDNAKNNIAYYQSRNVKYTAFGDSITSGVGSTGNNNSYANRLNTHFNFKAFNNRGVSGSSIVKHDNTAEILYTYTHALSNFEGIITILIGTNDFMGGSGSPLGNVDDIINADFSQLSAPSTTYDPDYTFAEGFRYTVEDLRKNNPNAKIIILLPINRHYANVPNAQGCILNDYAEAERKIAIAQGCAVVDTKECGIPMKQESIYTSDGLHPTDFGYTLITAFLIPIMENAVKTQYYFDSVQS